MRVQLRIHLDASPDRVWQAIRTPAVFRAVSQPLLEMQSREAEGMPPLWLGDSPHRISIALLGLLPLGEQTIDVTFSAPEPGTRMMTDAGKPQSGMLRTIRSWNHRMAVSASTEGTTLYRDRLDLDAGWATPLVWVSMWCFWQWRALKLKRLARRGFENLLAPA